MKFLLVRGQVVTIGLLVVVLGIFIPRIMLHALKTALEDFHY